VDAPPPAVAALLRREDGRYLFIRRAEGIAAAGYWSPVTGRIEPGESLERAVEREVREEVGLEVRAIREVHRCPTSNGAWTLVWFEVEPAVPLSPADPVSFRSDEVAETRWVTPAEVESLSPLFDATGAFFRTLVR
jgi:8-oxo-dGTP pyrophosphatase MutT (NUDIX family)